MLIEGGTQWLLIAASVLAAIGLVGVNLAFRGRMPAGLDILSWVTAFGLIAVVVIGFFDVGDTGLYVQALVSGILVPIWTIWLGFSLKDDTGSEPGIEPAPA